MRSSNADDEDGERRGISNDKMMMVIENDNSCVGNLVLVVFFPLRLMLH